MKHADLEQKLLERSARRILHLILKTCRRLGVAAVLGNLPFSQESASCPKLLATKPFLLLLEG